MDAWGSYTDRTIKGYFKEWQGTMPEGCNPYLRVYAWRGENTWIDLSNKGGRYKIAYMINSKANCGRLDEILKYRVTPATKESTFF